MRDDAAASDLVSTLLMVLVVVTLASVLAVAVVGALSRPAVADVSFAAGPVAPGSTSVNLTLRNGEPVPLASLRVLLGRAGASPTPTSLWSAPSPTTLAAGQALSVMLSPAAQPDETVRILLVRTDANAIVADLTVQAGGSASPYPPASLALAVAPATLPADGVSTSLVTARVSAPGGGLTVASVSLDTSPLTLAAGQPAASLDLNDLGQSGDAVGGDGVWSALLRAPAATPPGVYSLPLTATDAAGGVAASGNLTLTVASACIGCEPQNGQAATQGTRLAAPTSANVTAIRLRNFTWDTATPANLGGDIIVLRATGGGANWSATVSLDYLNGRAVATGLTLSTGANATSYVPRNASLPLAGLDLDLLNPIGSQQWTYSSGAADPAARYSSAGMIGAPILYIAQMGDASNGASKPTGIFSVDVVVR